MSLLRVTKCRPIVLTTATVMITVLVVQAAAQVPADYPNYPTQQARPPSPLRQAFAQSLASVAGNVGGAVAMGLSGAITTWLNRKAQGRAGQASAMNGYYPAALPAPVPMTTQPYFDPGAVPSAQSPAYGPDPQTSGYPSTDPGPVAGQVPSAGGGYPGEAGPIFDASGGTNSTGTPGYPGSTSTYPTANPSGLPDASAPPPSVTGVYAGIAYEVYALGAAGAQRVDPATHAFSSGDRFSIYYTPSLPGQVDIFNINPLGQRSHVDTVAVAGGQLVTLGPYEFRDQPGTETLLLVLSPCSTDALMNVTRTIVKAKAGSTPALNLAQCGNPATRGLGKGKRPKTRTIAKVGTEQGTSFAIDPLTAAEYSSGNVDPRQVAISLMHR